MEVEQRLAALGLSLPQALPEPKGHLRRALRHGNLVYVSGHGPHRADGSTITGKLGRDLTLEEGYQAARLCALNGLFSIKQLVGDLDRVRRVVKVLGFVNSTEDFTDQPLVMNGASDLLIDLYGDAGWHARSAVGMAQLPNNYAVEVEMIVEVEEGS